MNNIVKFVTFFMILNFATSSWALDPNDEDYDSIVHRLSLKKSFALNDGTSILDDVIFHVGLGLTNTSYGLRLADGDRTNSKQGFNLALGVDLFSPRWVSEIIFSNYGEQQNEDLRTELKEFDLKVVYKQPLTELWTWRVGVGLAARYLKVTQSDAINDFTTPSSILLTGVEAKITNSISAVTELGVRTPLVSDTAEKTAIDLLFRIDGHL